MHHFLIGDPSRPIFSTWINLMMQMLMSFANFMHTQDESGINKYKPLKLGTLWRKGETKLRRLK